ncbi:ring finger protein [Cercophora scortea]|uniref:Ring finger protein n=1 Tax=Cercophora scortea TaxID=314031 RepID=A0AAE0IFE6_9PEZI|nr:ring finger protein [Cercophora scortea]
MASPTANAVIKVSILHPPLYLGSPYRPRTPVRMASITMDDLVDLDFGSDYGSDFDFSFLEDNLNPVQEAREPAMDIQHNASQPVVSEPQTFREAVLSCFPDICLDYLEKAAAEPRWSNEHFISYLLDQQEKGKPYPTHTKSLKRKREARTESDGADENVELQKKFEQGNRPQNVNAGYAKIYLKTAKSLLMEDFPEMYAHDIETVLKENRLHLYPSYMALEAARLGEGPVGRFRIKKVPTRSINPEGAFRQSIVGAEKDAMEEYRAARKVCQAKASVRAAEKQREQDELENRTRAEAEGTMAECQCCFGDFPLNRMVHCNGETLHWFCYDCPRQNAEAQVGLSKYKIGCMSMDSCEAGFSMDQRAFFLDNKLAIALERIEQEAVLRMAGIENLESCPFCPYAAEYPPVAENKEFTCENLDCKMVSCRLCRNETHLPKTCEEALRENGHSARRAIEEAMSAAMIRSCNKCGTPFIKENGCNKMKCTLNGCNNVQCYICSKSCGYNHFNDASRGGKPGNCPLFDSTEARHEDEVRRAQEKALKEVAEQNPEVDATLLDFSFSDKVKADEQRRKAIAGHPLPHQHIPPAHY